VEHPQDTGNDFERSIEKPIFIQADALKCVYMWSKLQDSDASSSLDEDVTTSGETKASQNWTLLMIAALVKFCEPGRFSTSYFVSS